MKCLTVTGVMSAIEITPSDNRQKDDTEGDNTFDVRCEESVYAVGPPNEQPLEEAKEEVCR